MRPLSPTAKILIVDDEPNIVVALEFLLSQRGFQTAKAHRGEEALRLFPSFAPDLVVLDVMMPGMDGFEVARQIRSNPNYPNTRSIFLTARSTDEDRLKGYANGGDVYLPKPFDNETLLTTIKEVILYG